VAVRTGTCWYEKRPFWKCIDCCQLPEGFTLAEAVTLPNNFVTVFHTLTEDLGIETPWPRPDGYTPVNASKAILIWGGSSSVGQFAIQILSYYGYSNILTTASRKHHQRLRDLGAREVFDYNDSDVVSSISQGAGSLGISFVLDCIGSKQGSIAPISQIATRGTRVAILLPVIVKDSTVEQDPEYEMDVERAAEWPEGVDVRGVRTHFYLKVSIACMDKRLSQALTRIRMNFSNTTCSPTSCTPCSKTASFRRKSRGSWKVQRSCRGRRKRWTCCGKSRPVWRDWSGA
jgi:hypothetical protein